MTLSKMEGLERDYISVKEAADVIGCSPQRLRDGLDIDEERPIEMRRYLFPHCKVGNQHRIMREGFVRWVKGETMVPAAIIDRQSLLLNDGKRINLFASSQESCLTNNCSGGGDVN